VDKKTRYETTQPETFKANLYLQKNLILAAAKKAFLKGQQVEVVRQTSYNGDNCQISWCVDKEAWLIGSRMVSFLVKDSQALTTKDSKAFGAGIGKVAFKCAERLLSLLDGVRDVSSLKEDLTDHTLIGHFLSADESSLSDQVLMYKSDRLVFTAIVGNNSHRIALLPEQTCQILTKYDLPMAETKSLGVQSSYSEMCDALLKAHWETSTAKTAEVNEGAIFWLIRRSDKQMGDRVLSLSQVESLEFVMLREIKMSLRSFMKSTA